MIKIIKEEIEIDESLISRLNVICDFCNTKPIIENGSIRRIEYINGTYTITCLLKRTSLLSRIKKNSTRLNNYGSKKT